MPHVDITSKDYDANKSLWQKCRDCFAGQEVIHKKGEEYLPKLSGQDKDQYDAYKKRTLFYNAFGRTVQGLTGMVMRKEPDIQYSNDTNIEEFLEDVTATGEDFPSFAEGVLEELNIVGRGGVLTEYPRVETKNLSMAEAERLGLRPYWRYFQTEDIRYHRTRSINNQKTLTMVILSIVESEVSKEDEFEMDEEEVLLVLDLETMEGGTRRYRQRRFKKTKDDKGKTDWLQDGPDIVPRVNGKTLEHIPFRFFGVRNTAPEASKPPLLDLANANINHYQKEADHSNALHVVGVPTPYVSGVSMDGNETIKLGTTTCVVIKDPQGRGGFIELEGKSLDSLKDKIESLEERMAFLGAKMLAPEKRAAEAAETAQIHRQGEVSVTSSMANGASSGLRDALKDVAMFFGKPDLDISVQLNTDFIAWPMDANLIKTIMLAWQGGAIGFSDMITAFKSGEVIREDRTVEDIQSEIQTSRPSGMNAGANFN